MVSYMWTQHSPLAPKVFTAVADALQFILEKHGVHRIMQYLDDFLLFGAPGSSQCCEALQLAMDCCNRLGVPIAERKTEGPKECITFLGIELETAKKSYVCQKRNYNAYRGKSGSGQAGGHAQKRIYYLCSILVIINNNQ